MYRLCRAFTPISIAGLPQNRSKTRQCEAWGDVSSVYPAMIYPHVCHDDLIGQACMIRGKS